MKQYPKKSKKKTGNALIKEKEIAFERDGHQCQVCDRHLFFTYADFHHVILRSKLRLDVAQNMITVCRLCHTDIHGMQNGQSTGEITLKYWDRVRGLL